MLTKYFVAQNYSIISRRGENSIILFPEIPYWIATTKQGEEFLEKLDGKKNILEISNEVLGEGNESIAIEFLEPLVESEAVIPLGKKTITNDDISKVIIKPDKVTLLQTMRCNLKCKHCSVADQTESADRIELNLEDVKTALINVSKIMGENKRLAFLGGEPLLGKNFLAVAEFAYEQGFQLGISTNGLLIDETFAKKAKELNMQVQISLDGPTKESHEFIRGRNTFDKTINAIKLLKKYDVNLQTNMVFHKDNVDLIPKYIELGKQFDIKSLRLIPLLNMGRAKENLGILSIEEMVDKIISLIKTDPELIPYLSDTNFMGLVTNARLTNRMIGCGSGIITVILDPKGDIYPCLNTYREQYKIINVFEDDFEKKFFESEIHKKFRSLRIDQLNDTCASCDFRYVCGGLCRGETMEVTSDLEAPYPYCESWKNAMIKIYWLLTEYPELGKEKEERVLQNERFFSVC